MVPSPVSREGSWRLSPNLLASYCEILPLGHSSAPFLSQETGGDPSSSQGVGTGCVPLSGTPPPACHTSVLGQALGRVPGPSYYPGPEAARSGLCGSLHSVQLAYCAACRGGLFLCFPLSVARGGTQRSGGHGGQAGRCVPLFPQPAALSVHSALVLELPSAWPLIFLKHLLCAGDFSPMRRSCRAAGFQGTAD